MEITPAQPQPKGRAKPSGCSCAELMLSRIWGKEGRCRAPWGFPIPLMKSWERGEALLTLPNPPRPRRAQGECNGMGDGGAGAREPPELPPVPLGRGLGTGRCGWEITGDIYRAGESLPLLPGLMMRPIPAASRSTCSTIGAEPKLYSFIRKCARRLPRHQP